MNAATASNLNTTDNNNVISSVKKNANVTVDKRM